MLMRLVVVEAERAVNGADVGGHVEQVGLVGDSSVRCWLRVVVAVPAVWCVNIIKSTKKYTFYTFGDNYLLPIIKYAMEKMAFLFKNKIHYKRNDILDDKNNHI